ncbi:MAG: DUF2141 domain-containing protein [Flavobacteriales bacterium]|nr:DUF2141 domain-containing protein [Flavobacteriales bacterium]
MLRSLIILLLAFPFRLAAQGSLSLVVELLKPPTPGATVNVLICSTAHCWAESTGGVTHREPATYPTTRLTIADLPPGQWAIKVFVDDNTNGKLDTNILGIPTEPYGFSNNAMRPMGPPYLADATFTVREGVNVHRIKMR